MIKSLDHIALRLSDKCAAFHILNILGYFVEDEFEIDFGEEGKAESVSLTTPPSSNKLTEIFLTDGEPGTVIGEWVEKNGQGIHHLAFATDNIQEDIDKFRLAGILFSTPNYLSCDDLKQIFTKPIEALGGIVIELIERKTKGFCAGNVKALMESTKERNDYGTTMDGIDG